MKYIKHYTRVSNIKHYINNERVHQISTSILEYYTRLSHINQSIKDYPVH